MSITPQSWTFAESLYLLQLYNTENDDIWQFCSSSLQKKFGRKRPSGFFEKKLCEKRLSEILSEGHPEHVLPEKDGHFSRKELINSWISYMRKKAEEERQRNIELILVEMRKTAEIINRLNSDDCDMTADEMKKLIEEQKERDKNKNQELLQAELAYYRRKIREMEALRKANPGMYPRIPIVIPPSHPTSLDTDEPQSPIKPLFDDAGLSLREKAVPTTTMNLRSVSQSPIKSHMSQVHVKIPVSPVKSPRKKTARSPTTTENEFPNIVREMNVVSSNSLSKPNADSCLTETVGKSPAAFSKTTALLTSDDNETTAANDFGSSSCISTEISCGEEAASSSQAIAIRPPSSLLLVSDRHSVRPAGPVKMTKNEGKLSLSDEGDQDVTILYDNADTETCAVPKSRSRRSDTISERGEISKQSADTHKSKQSGRTERSAKDILGAFDTQVAKIQHDPVVYSRGSPRRSTADVMKLERSCSGVEDGICYELSSPSASSTMGAVSSESPSAEVAPQRRSTRRGTVCSQKSSPTSQPSAVGKRKHSAGGDAFESDVTEQQGSQIKRRRFLSRASVAEEDNKNKEKLLDSSAVINVEVQSSPEPEELSRFSRTQIADVSSDSEEDETLGSILSKGRSTRNALGSASPANITFSEREAPLSTGSQKARRHTKRKGRPRKDTKLSPTVTTTQLEKKDDEKEDGAEIEQKPLLMAAWRMVSSHRHAAIFAHPVLDRDVCGYSKAVKRRMDLATLKKLIDSGQVRDMREFKHYLLLMFANAVMFNSTGHDVNNYAREMAADSLRNLKAMSNDILSVKGGVHATRRSTANLLEVHPEKKKSSSRKCSLNKEQERSFESEDSPKREEITAKRVLMNTRRSVAASKL